MLYIILFILLDVSNPLSYNRIKPFNQKVRLLDKYLLLLGIFLLLYIAID